MLLIAQAPTFHVVSLVILQIRSFEHLATDLKMLNLCVFRFKMPYYVDIRSLLGYNKLVKLILSCLLTTFAKPYEKSHEKKT